MATAQKDTYQSTTPRLQATDFRPLYIRRVPEAVWILVHDNAVRSRMRLQDYLVRILTSCEPLPVTTLQQPAGQCAAPQASSLSSISSQ